MAGTDEPSGGPAAESFRRPRLLIVGIAVAAIVTTLVTTGIVVRAVLDRDSGERDTGFFAQQQTRGSFPDPPRLGWQVAAGTVAPPTFGRPSFGVGTTDEQRSDVIDLGDALVTSISNKETGGAPALVALDTETGGLKWRIDGNAQKCAGRTVDGLLPCVLVSLGRIVSLVRMSDGGIERTLSADGPITHVEVVGDDVITVRQSAAVGFAAVVASGDTESLTANWEVRPVQRATCQSTGDVVYFGADEHVVHFGDDAGETVVRTEDGSDVFDRRLAGLQVRRGQGLIGETCGGTSANENRTVHVFDPSGRLLREHAGRSGWSVDGGVTNSSPYVVGTDARDFTSGNLLWTSGDAAGNGLWRDFGSQLVADVVLVSGTACSGCSGQVTAYSTETGAKRWGLSGGLTSDKTGADWLTDGRRIIMVGGDELSAVDVTTGKQVWSVPVGRGTSLHRAGNGFIVRSENAVSYFR